MLPGLGGEGTSTLPVTLPYAVVALSKMLKSMLIGIVEHALGLPECSSAHVDVHERQRWSLTARAFSISQQQTALRPQTIQGGVSGMPLCGHRIAHVFEPFEKGHNLRHLGRGEGASKGLPFLARLKLWVVGQ